MKVKTKLDRLKSTGLALTRISAMSGIHYRRLRRIQAGEVEAYESEVESIGRIYRQWRYLLKQLNSNQD